MDLRFRHREEADKYAPRTPLTKYSTTLLAQSMEFSNHRLVRMADEFHGSVLSFRDKWYAVDLHRRTCSCGRFGYNDVPCGHAIAVIQGFRAAGNEGPQRSARDFVSYNLTVAALKATYARVYLRSISRICNRKKSFLASHLASGSFVDTLKRSV